jgi:SAM-dependent methyltransferase
VQNSHRQSACGVFFVGEEDEVSWYEGFFGHDYLHFHLLGGEWLEERTAGQCDFLVTALGLEPGARVLDLCCGQGRHAVELARRGYAVTGLDLSEYLLGLAAERAERAGVSVEFVRRDMRDLPWTDEFDAVVNMFTAFGYLETDAEDEKVLHAVRRCLKPAGRLVLDLHNRELTAICFRPRHWEEHEGHLILDDLRWDGPQGRLHLARTIIAPDGRRREHGFALRIYSQSELNGMLTRAGLEWEQAYDRPGASMPYHALSRGMTVVARKPPGGPGSHQGVRP